MKNSVKLNLPAWVIVAAVILAALIGWSLMSTSSMSYGSKGQMAPRTKAQMQAMNTTLDKALGQMDVALQHAGLAGKAKDLAGLQTHVHQALNVMEGQGGPDYDASAGKPGDGHGVQVYLQDMMKACTRMGSGPMAMGMMAGPMTKMRAQMVQTLQSTQQAGQKAVKYLNEALKAKMLAAAQGSLKEAMKELQVMKGMPGSMSPKTGGLTLARMMMTRMMKMISPAKK